MLVVNGEKISEMDKGDYFPWWLRDLSTAIVDPLPNPDILKQANARVPKAQGVGASNCVYLPTKIDRWSVCFDAKGLFEYVGLRGFHAEFRDYKGFTGKRIARTVVLTPEPGTTIEAQIKRLDELSHPDEGLFVVSETTPIGDRIRSLQVDQETVRNLATTPTEIKWPAVGGGPAKGGCGVYISADRKGKIREVWPNGCDNTGLEDPLRELVGKWTLKPAAQGGGPVQVESLVTFSFNVEVGPSQPLPELTNDEARSLASEIVEPNFPAGSVPHGTDVIVSISVDETGKLTGVGNPQNLKTEALLAANAALKRWKFHPYLKNGKPQYFHASIVFHAN